MATNFHIGQRLSFDSSLCTVRYVGEVAGTTGAWLGVEWDNASRGKHAGVHKGVRYLTCKNKSPTAASFVRATRRPDWPRSFVSAVQDKYASEVGADGSVSAGVGARAIVFSGKVAEEVGFDKVRRQLARLDELKVVILDGMLIDSAGGGDEAAGEKSIAETCPRITELDISRNLFERFATVVEICAQLKDLKGLRLNGNRFTDIVGDEVLNTAQSIFAGVRELALEETLLTWEEICHVASKFPALTSLQVGTNQLSSLSETASLQLPATLTTLNLEYNDFTALSDLAGLTVLKNLRNLHLKGCNITSVISSPSIQAPVFPSTIQYLDISYNQVSSWSLVDALPHSFPGLSSLRLSHNPIYENPGADSDPDSSRTSAAAGGSGGSATVTEETYMIAVARLAPLRALNFSAVTPDDRTNAEMFYLSRIAQQMAAVPEGAEASVAARHPRYAELCDLYGEPAVVRASDVNPNFLEARLVNVRFVTSAAGAASGGSGAGGGGGGGGEGGKGEEKTAQIPKSLDVYAVKGIAARMFGLSPLRLGLVWETGEWDPVADYDYVPEEDEDSSEGEEAEAAMEKRQALSGGGVGAVDEEKMMARKGGRWVKREVELKDSPRQFGFCVDGLDVRIRVEAR